MMAKEGQECMRAQETRRARMHRTIGMKQSGNFDFFVGMVWHASAARSSLLRFKDFWGERGFAMYVAGRIRLSDSYWVVM